MALGDAGTGGIYRTPLREARLLCACVTLEEGFPMRNLTSDLLQHDLRLVTGLRNKMREKLLPMWDKLMLRKRSLFETVIDQLKNICQIRHTRHRSPANYLVNILTGLVAYTHQPKRPSLHMIPEKTLPLNALAEARLLMAYTELRLKGRHPELWKSCRPFRAWGRSVGSVAS